MTDTDKICAAFAAITDLAIATGARDIDRLPGCWEWAFVGWTIAVNGHREATKASNGFDVPPFHAYVERRGLPCLLVNPRGGSLLGASSAEDDFIAAVEAETARCAEIERYAP